MILRMRFQKKWIYWLAWLLFTSFVHIEGSVVEQLHQYPGLSPRQKGVILINEFGCVSCHTSSQNHFKPRRGPDLSGLGNRVKPEWLKGFLKTPHHVSAGATHLDFPAEVPDSEDMSRSQIENGLMHPRRKVQVAELVHL